MFCSFVLVKFIQMSKFTKFFFLAIMCSFLVMIATAQKTTKPAQKFKPPALHTSLGTYRDSVTIPVQEAERIIALPLMIYDAKKVGYIVSSYNFLYKRRVVTEDEKTGKVSPASSISSSLFTATPLPALWVDQVREKLKPGEELYFFDVIAKDAQGRVMYAPNLKILTQ
jgi:hypothetical protein